MLDNRATFDEAFAPFKQQNLSSEHGKEAFNNLMNEMQNVFDCKVDLNANKINKTNPNFQRVYIEYDRDASPFDWKSNSRDGSIKIPERALEELPPTMNLGIFLHEYRHALQVTDGQELVGSVDKSSAIAHDILPQELDADKFVWDVFDNFGFDKTQTLDFQSKQGAALIAEKRDFIKENFGKDISEKYEDLLEQSELFHDIKAYGVENEKDLTFDAQKILFFNRGEDIPSGWNKWKKALIEKYTEFEKEIRTKPELKEMTEPILAHLKAGMKVSGIEVDQINPMQQNKQQDQPSEKSALFQSLGQSETFQGKDLSKSKIESEERKIAQKINTPKITPPTIIDKTK